MIRVPIWSRQIVYSLLTMLGSVTVIGLLTAMKQFDIQIFTVNLIQQVLIYLTFCILSYGVWCDAMEEEEAPKPYYDAHSQDRSIELDRSFASVYLLNIVMLYSPIFLTVKLIIDLLFQ